MKTAVALICSLVLAWTNIVLAQVPEASEAPAVRTCQCNCGKNCCATNPSLPQQQPVSTAPVSSLRTQFASLTPLVVAWTLPHAAAPEFSSLLLPPLTTAGTALCARNCAWLI